MLVRPPAARRTRPMESPLHLRPLSIGEILDRSFRLYRNHFLQWFTAVLLVQCISFVIMQIYLVHAVMPLLQSLNAPRGELPDVDPAVLVNFGVGLVIVLLVYGLLSLLYTGAVISLTSDAFLGRETTLLDAYRLALRRFGALLALNISKFSMLSTSLVIWLAPIIVALLFRAWWLAGSWVIVGALPFLFAYLWLALASIALILEERRPLDSIKRSGRLMYTLTEKGFLRNNAFRISIILLIIFAVRIIVMLVIQGPYTSWKLFEVYRDPSLLGQYHRTLVDSAFEFVNMVMQAATTPFGIASLVVFYYDIRIRKEGFDLFQRLRWLRKEKEQPECQPAKV